MTPSPADIIASLDRTATRIVTPVASGEMVWRAWGAGYPLVLLHGGSGSWMHWVRNIEDIARDYRVIAADQPGFGESTTPEGEVTPDSMAALVHEGLMQVLVPDAHFTYVGFSMGASVAGHAAPLAGDRVDRVVLAGVAGLNMPSPPMEPLKSWRRLTTEAERDAAHRRNLAILMLHDPASIDDLAAHVQARVSAQARVRRVNVSSRGRLVERLGQTPAAVSSIWGEFDAIAKGHLEERRLLVERIKPGATFDVIPGAGHWVQYEAAGTFNRLLRERVGT